MTDDGIENFYKLKTSHSPPYMYELIPLAREVHYSSRAPCQYELCIERTVRFSNIYFQDSFNEWNSLDASTRPCQTISQFKRNLLSQVRPLKRSTFDVYDIEGVTRLRVEFSDLTSHGFKHNFLCSSPFCSCQTRIEDNQHFLLHCLQFTVQR